MIHLQFSYMDMWLSWTKVLKHVRIWRSDGGITKKFGCWTYRCFCVYLWGKRPRNKLIRLSRRGLILFSFGHSCDSWIKIGHPFPGKVMKPMSSNIYTRVRNEKIYWKKKLFHLKIYFSHICQTPNIFNRKENYS